jgi:exonuclease III
MRLISWNCQGAFRKKADFIISHQPDILVVQECEHPDKYVFSSTTKKPTSQYWYGDNTHKGISVFSFSNCKLELLPVFNPEFRYIIPFQVIGLNHSLTLFAIWAMNNKEHYDARYIGQIWLAINHYKNLLDTPSILIGDFNSNKIWDYKGRVGNHSDVVRKLSDHNIQSIYHNHFHIEQGVEIHPTFFLQRNLNKPYHIDYCFASDDILHKVKNVEIGTYDNWTAYSDHSPLLIDLDL